LGPIVLKASETLRLRRVARDALYKEGQQQLVIPLRRGVDPATHLLDVLGQLFPDETRLMATASAPVTSGP
jgi:hypothetical protein